MITPVWRACTWLAVESHFRESVKIVSHLEGDDAWNRGLGGRKVPRGYSMSSASSNQNQDIYIASFHTILREKPKKNITDSIVNGYYGKSTFIRFDWLQCFKTKYVPVKDLVCVKKLKRYSRQLRKLLLIFKVDLLDSSEYVSVPTDNAIVFTILFGPFNEYLRWYLLYDWFHPKICPQDIHNYVIVWSVQ